MIENAGGKDSTEAYLAADHTRRAREMVKKYYIGDFE
jgi:cytochrome b involved in lipid metabolism